MQEYYGHQEHLTPPSPGLERIEIDYNFRETPPPCCTTTSSSSASPQPPARGKGDRGDEKAGTSARTLSTRATGKKRKRKRKSHHRPCQGDAVLITYLAPNRPDIAREAGQHALNSSASQSEIDDDQRQEMSGVLSDVDVDADADDQDGKPLRASGVEDAAYRAPEDAVMEEHGPSQRPLSSDADTAVMTGHNATLMGHSLRPWHPPVPLRISAPSTAKPYHTQVDSIASSPALAKYAIPAAEANRDSILPAMQMSPPRSASACSPESSQSLPSLQTALGTITDVPLTDTPSDTPCFPQATGRWPPMAYPIYPGHPSSSPRMYSQPSPNSAIEMANVSSPGYSNFSTPWRSIPDKGSSSSSTLLPPASMTNLDPVNHYLTPKDELSPAASTSPHQLSGGPLLPPLPPTPAGAGASPISAGGLAGNRNYSSNTYKCKHPGCAAEPFQTQYLLNSHANVHSSSRPYYCPVPQCSHSVGGKGFKRKNEMNRHSLVHSSPGYACPFCADQQHKYPRPDNLQRHVRAHHPDKTRDDAQLRAVLALRSSGDVGGSSSSNSNNNNNNHETNNNNYDDNGSTSMNHNKNNNNNNNHNRGRRRRTSLYPDSQQQVRVEE